MKRNFKSILKHVVMKDVPEKVAEEVFSEPSEVAYYSCNPTPRIKNIEKNYLKKKRMKILDIGCASGRETFFLASKGHIVKGIDISKEMIYRATELKKKNKIINSSFEVKDVVNLNEKRKYDAVISLFNVLTFIYPEANRRKAIKNMIDALKIGGMLIIETSNKFGDLRAIFKQIVFKVSFMLALKNRQFGDVYSSPCIEGSGKVVFQHYLSKREIENYLSEQKNIKYKILYYDLYNNIKSKNNLLVIIRRTK